MSCYRERKLISYTYKEYFEAEKKIFSFQISYDEDGCFEEELYLSMDNKYSLYVQVLWKHEFKSDFLI